MAFKFIVLCAVLAINRVSAGVIGAPAIGVAYSAAPAVSHVHYSSPLVTYGAPLAAATPAITSQSGNILRSFGNLGQVSTYTKTIDTPFSSVQKADVRISNPGLRIASGYAAAPAFGYAAPALGYAAAPALGYAAHAPAAVGVAYSAAPAVSQVHYSSPLATYGAPLATPTITSQSGNILRSFGNLGQVSTYSKTIDTPFSSVQKSDVRVSNPGVRIATGYAAAPALGYAGVHGLGYAGAHGVGYAGAHGLGYASAHGLGYAGAHGLGYAAAHGVGYAAAPAAVGVAYSAAPAVSHFTYTGNYGVNYGW